jgi:hypothetical protein
MLDLGPLRYFLGIEVSSTSDGFFISQEHYIQDLLVRVDITDELLRLLWSSIFLFVPLMVILSLI